jgi:hypothetical protein
MAARLLAGCLLAVAVAGCFQGDRASFVPRRECGLPDAAACDAIVRQVAKRAATVAQPPVTVVVPFHPDEVFSRGGDFSVFVAFATLNPGDPVSTWTATKLGLVTGELPTDWSVGQWNEALPPHVVAALRKAQATPAP